jgi:hypothetical protein
LVKLFWSVVDAASAPQFRQDNPDVFSPPAFIAALLRFPGCEAFINTVHTQEAELRAEYPRMELFVRASA